ncbi:uncharacterized protein LOC133201750 isoform X2 [Saccostrea echinata]|uniref:uncharacterized protein LOC133201750 isoform X2 n=1 Tax=Saccostrea echinata TaxID=191078 RepID=UPI002A825F22|nr:uncharacterized protein LOC133201750 isoform X2 [Saccostrea echinata]
MVEVLVEFDYDAEQEDELTIKVGDIIKNVQMSEGGWWEGELNGKKGMFPDNFVKVIEKKKEEPKKDLLVAQQRSSVKELASKLKDVHVGAAPQKRKDHHHTEKRKKAKVLFDYEPENEDELKIEVGDIVEVIKQEEEGWWEGVVNGKTGVFPSNFVEVIEEESNEVAPDTPQEEKHEVKGKKVMGVGLGNIFEGGPIKLRSTAASAKKPVEKLEPKPPVTEEPPVLKREKPVLHANLPPIPVPRMSQVNMSNTHYRKATPVPTPRGYPAWSQRDNGHSPTIKYRPDYASADNVEEKTSLFHHAYQRDIELEHLSIRHLVQTSDPCIPSSVESSRPTKPCIPLYGDLLQNTALRSASDHIKPIIDMFERKQADQDTTASSLDDSNKENIDRESSKISPENQSKMKRKAAQKKRSILSHLKFLPFKARKLDLMGQGSKSETECSGEFTPLSEETQDEGQCMSVPFLHSKNMREDLMEERKPLRPIALHDINDTDPDEYPYMSSSDYRAFTPEFEVDYDDHKEDMEDAPCQDKKEQEGATSNAQPSTKNDKNLSSQKETRKLSPFVSSLADKYNLVDWRDKRWKKYVNIEHGIVSPICSKAGRNRSNNAVQDEDSTISMFFEKSSPEKTQCNVTDDQRAAKSAENLHKDKRTDPVRESMSTQDSSRYSKGGDLRGVDNRRKKFPTTFVTAAEVYRNLSPEKSLIQDDHADKQKKKAHRKGNEEKLKSSDVKSPNYLEDIFSGASAIEEDPLSTSLEGLDKFIRANMADSVTDTYDENEMCSRSPNPWVSPKPKYDLRHKVQNAYFDEHLIYKFENSLSPKNLTEQEILEDLDSKLNAYCNVETQTSETLLQTDEFYKERKRNDAAPFPEVVSYEPSLDHSDCDTPQVTPGKKSAKARYSSSPKIRAEQHGDYDIEGTAENGLNLEVIGKRLKTLTLGDDIDAQVEDYYDIEGTEENGMDLKIVGQKVRLYTPDEEERRIVRLMEDCSEKRKRRLSWKRLFQPKGIEPVQLISYRRTDIMRPPLQGSPHKSERSKAAKESLKMEDVDENETIVNVVFRPEDVTGTVETVFCHDFSDEEGLSRNSSLYPVNISPSKIQSQSNESQTSQRLIPKESPGACNLVKYSMEDIVKELEKEGQRIEKEFLRIATENAYDFMDLESECQVNNPHSLMYLAGMACSKRYQLLYNSDILEDSNVGDKGYNSHDHTQEDSEYDLCVGRKHLEFIKDDFSEPSRSEETVDEEIDQDICPDSPGLIASMTRDVQSLNLTQSPNSSDADIAKRIDSFLRDALKPIDDMTFRNDTSDDDMGEDEKENLNNKAKISSTSYSEDRITSYTPCNSPCVVDEGPKFSMEFEEEECSALNKSFTTEDSEMDQSVKEALEEVEGVTPVLLDHQLQETESSDSDDRIHNDVEDNDDDDEDNTNNNFDNNDASNNSEMVCYGRISDLYPGFNMMSPLIEQNEGDSMLSSTFTREEAQAEEPSGGYELRASKSDTRSIDTTGSDKFYTDVDTSMDNSGKFYTDLDTDLDETMEDRSFGALRRIVRSSRSPASSDDHGVVDWSMDDSIEV